MVDVNSRSTANVPIKPPIVCGAYRGELIRNFTEPMVNPISGGDIAASVCDLELLCLLAFCDVQFLPERLGRGVWVVPQFEAVEFAVNIRPKLADHLTIAVWTSRLG